MINSCINIIEKVNGYYFIRQTDTYSKGVKLVHVGQLYKLLYSKGGYIKNLSVLREDKKIMNNYLLNKDSWRKIKNILVDMSSENNLNSLSIIKVEDLESYISKLILLKWYKVILQKDCYALLKNDSYDVVLVSDVNLVVNSGTEFNLSGLCIKYIMIENIDIANEEIGVVNRLADLFNGCFFYGENRI